MRVFGIKPDGRFSEYRQTPFQIQHEESILEDWLESNPDGILENGRILIIGRQARTNFGGFIDLVGLDREGDVVVVELKRDRTPRDTIAQAIEYASFVERLDTNQLEAMLKDYMNDESLNIAEYHRDYFEIGTDEAVAFNKNQHIVVVGQKITPEIRQTATFLRSKGFKVTCVEFTFFLTEGGTRLLSQEIVVGSESEKLTHVSSGSLPVTTEEIFLASADENGREVFTKILEFAKARSMPIHWGTKGFSLNVNLDGTHVAILFVYPPDSVFKQTLRAALRDKGEMGKKVAVPEDVIQELWQQAVNTGLFIPAGRGLKCHITHKLSGEEVESLLLWLEAIEGEIRKHGLKQ
jgi:hypothetical protein